MFLEDILVYVVFNYCLYGFRDFLIDYFVRLFWIEIDKFLNGKCINNRFVYNVFFNYLLSFFWSYKNWFNFVFLFYVLILYDDVNMIGYVDEDLMIFL